MYKNIILLTSLVLLIGCSQTKIEKKVKVVDQNKTSKKNVLPKKFISKKFIPKHILLSHIEVVPH